MTRHFDRSCSQSHREQRSGEIRFSTSTVSQPQLAGCRILRVRCEGWDLKQSTIHNPPCAFACSFCLSFRSATEESAFAVSLSSSHNYSAVTVT
jgi:hypothetical protein